jgi:hypothetical protein
MACQSKRKLHKAGGVIDAGTRTFGRQTRCSALAILMFALWLMVHCLAAVPQIHHHLHAEAASGQHQCPVTEFAQAGFEPVATTSDVVRSDGPMAVEVLPLGCFPPSRTFFPPHAARPPPSACPSFSQAGA